MGSDAAPCCHRYGRVLVGEFFHCGIVGINQIFDRDIHVLNNPFLPVASGEMSRRVAWVTVLFSGIVGPAIAIYSKQGEAKFLLLASCFIILMPSSIEDECNNILFTSKIHILPSFPLQTKIGVPKIAKGACSIWSVSYTL
eukprot:CCRYP_017013-RB/>CCRYP_017013-RB protein AED:0.49 eAED:0.45 QI:0/0/0/1/0/0/2/0/140